MALKSFESESVTSILSTTQVVFDGYRKALQDRITLLEAEQKEEKSSEIAKTLQELHKLMVLTIEHIRMVEDARAREKGGGVAGGLDLDSARDEVCRRLARLRATRSGGGLSGGSE